MLREALAAAFGRLRRPLPLIRYLVMSTEVHAYCAGLAFFAMLGFYPFSLVMLSVAKYVFSSEPAYTAVQEVLRTLYPTSQEFLLRNLEASSWEFGQTLTLQSVLWVLLGAAGIFIPLETAFNELWGFDSHRPYWRNQLVGFALTLACCGLAVPAVFVIGALGSHPLAVGGVLLFYGVVSLFLFYRFLPHGRVSSLWVLPGAIFGGVGLLLVRWLFVVGLPLLDLPQSQGPYYVSVSFLLLAYFGAFAVLAGAYMAAQEARASEPPEPGDDAEVLGVAPEADQEDFSE